MHFQNVESGVLRALKAFKVEGGMSDAEASAWATSRLAAGVTRFEAILRQSQYRQNPELGAQAAFADLKTWAQS